MTDNDIIEAIEYCSSHDDCDLKCPIGKETTADEGCIRTIGRLALDIINRQKVEIDILIRKKETLKDEISELRAEVERLREVEKLCATLYADAKGGAE